VESGEEATFQLRNCLLLSLWQEREDAEWLHLVRQVFGFFGLNYARGGHVQRGEQLRNVVVERAFYLSCLRELQLGGGVFRFFGFQDLGFQKELAFLFEFKHLLTRVDFILVFEQRTLLVHPIDERFVVDVVNVVGVKVCEFDFRVSVDKERIGKVACQQKRKHSDEGLEVLVIFAVVIDEDSALHHIRREEVRSDGITSNELNGLADHAGGL